MAGGRTSFRHRGEEGGDSDSEVFDIIFYLDGDQNILTAENLRRMDELEKQLFYDREYQSDYCWTREHRCVFPWSLVRLFDGSYLEFGNEFYDPQFERVSDVFRAARENSYLRMYISGIVGEFVQYDVTEDEVIVTNTTGMKLFLGRPIPGYHNHTERKDEQEDKITDFLIRRFSDRLDSYAENGFHGMGLTYSHDLLVWYFVSGEIYGDITLLALGFVFMYVFLIFQTQSIFVSSLTYLSCIGALFSTNVVYRYIFDFRYFGFFHILALFILISISADDIFVFFDAWRESARYRFFSLAHRLSFCYRRSSFATSLTTAVAFFASASIPFLIISSFGVFSATLVIINYCTIHLYLPTVIAVYHEYFEKYTYCYCCNKKSGKTQNYFHHDHILNEEDILGSDYDNLTASSVILQKEDLSKIEERAVAVRILLEWHFVHITDKKGRWFILVFFLLLSSVFLYFVTVIEVNSGQVRILIVCLIIPPPALHLPEHARSHEPPCYKNSSSDLISCHL